MEETPTSTSCRRPLAHPIWGDGAPLDPCSELILSQPESIGNENLDVFSLTLNLSDLKLDSHPLMLTEHRECSRLSELIRTWHARKHEAASAGAFGQFQLARDALFCLIHDNPPVDIEMGVVALLSDGDMDATAFQKHEFIVKCLDSLSSVNRYRENYVCICWESCRYWL